MLGVGSIRWMSQIILQAGCFEDEFECIPYVGYCNKHFRPLYRVKGQNLNSARESVKAKP